MTNSDTVTMPMDHTVRLTVTEDDAFKHPTLYQEAIGALLYALLGTRPDITFAVQMLIMGIWDNLGKEDSITR